MRSDPARPARRLYRRAPCDPPPASLAQKLADAQVAASVAKRLDDFDRLHHQHWLNFRAQARLALGTAGLALGVAPSLPGLIDDCAPARTHVDGRPCAARLSALAGALIALGVTLWSAYELVMESNIAEQKRRLNDEVEREMQAVSGEVTVTNLLGLYRQMDASERAVFRTELHRHSREPTATMLAARMMLARNMP